MIDYQKPAIGEEKSAIDDKKSAVDMIKSAIEQQKYNEPSKANILKVYDEIEKNQIFGTKEIKEILDCSPSTARAVMTKLRDMKVVKAVNGKEILHAATAFGKTVVCSAVITEKKVNTLILLESSALIEQWKDALNKFLIIDEELPQYKTKTGRLRTRKSLIGTLQGAHDSMTGIIDIAMAGSLCKKGE